MIKSKDIADFFSVNIQDLIPDTVIPVTLYLYFKRNNHLMVWKNADELISTEVLDKYKGRGLQTIWVHNDDKDAFMKYLEAAPAEDSVVKTKTSEENADNDEGDNVLSKDKESKDINVKESNQEEDKESGDSKGKEKKKKKDRKKEEAKAKEPKTEAGAMLNEIIKDKKMDKKEKKEVVSEIAKEVIEEVAASKNSKEQEKANKKAQQVVEDMLIDVTDNAKELVREILDIIKADPDLEHAINVSTYSTIFAMAFGQVDSDVLSDVATAGLLHDLGLTQIPRKVAITKWNEMTKQDASEYEKHVKFSDKLIEWFAPDVSKRARQMISQHHEKFDGTGYPNKVQGFDFQETSQVLAMADLVDSISCGRWDGERRTMKQTMEVLQEIEKKKNFPEYLNPDIFHKVIEWTQSSADDRAMKEAVKMVRDQAKGIVES